MSTQAILFIHHANDMYGADIGLLHTVKSLDREKYYPIVILPSDMPPPGMLSSELERLGIEYHITPLGILRRKYLLRATSYPWRSSCQGYRLRSQDGPHAGASQWYMSTP
jgi:hypothetical protein